MATLVRLRLHYTRRRRPFQGPRYYRGRRAVFARLRSKEPNRGISFPNLPGYRYGFEKSATVELISRALSNAAKGPVPELISKVSLPKDTSLRENTGSKARKRRGCRRGHARASMNWYPDEVAPSADIRYPGAVIVGLMRPSAVGPTLVKLAGKFADEPLSVAPTVTRSLAVAGGVIPDAPSFLLRKG